MFLTNSNSCKHGFCSHHPNEKKVHEFMLNKKCFCVYCCGRKSLIYKICLLIDKVNDKQLSYGSKFDILLGRILFSPKSRGIMYTKRWRYIIEPIMFLKKLFYYKSLRSGYGN